MRIVIAELLLVFVALGTSSQAMFGGASAVHATVCEVSANPAHFAGKMVMISGSIMSDGIEYIALFDKSCPDSGVALTMPEHFRGDEELFKALGTGHPGTLDKDIQGTFVGAFTWRRRSVPQRMLVIHEARNITISIKG